MPLFPGIVPKPGEIYMCDFSGYVEPEIVKLRRVVIISPRNQGAPLALVVPISTVAPWDILPIHVRLDGDQTYRCFSGAREVWVKCDLVAHVRFDRLDRVRIPVLDNQGKPIKRRYEYIAPIALSAEDFSAVRRGVLHALGLGRLATHL